MVGESIQLKIIGSRDSWTYELIDVAKLLGFEPTLVSLIEENTSTPVSALKFLDIQEVQPLDSVFTGYELLEGAKDSSHPERVQRSRKILIQRQINLGVTKWVNLLHPNAWISPTAHLSLDIFVGANSSVGSNTEIDSHVTINRNASVGHDVKIEQGCEIGPMCAVSSGAKLGPWAFLGPGAVILNDIVVGENAVIGAGSVVTKNVLPGQTVVGVPAKEI